MSPEHTSHRWLVALVVTIALITAACSGGSESSSEGTAQITASAVTSPPPTASGKVEEAENPTSGAPNESQLAYEAAANQLASMSELVPGTPEYDLYCDVDATWRNEGVDLDSIPGGPWHHDIPASTFGIGEPPDSTNAFITNEDTAWATNAARLFARDVEGNPVGDFWGPLDPENAQWDRSIEDWYQRNGLCPLDGSYQPATLLQSVFYVALPTPDYADSDGNLTEGIESALAAGAEFLPELMPALDGSFVDEGESPFCGLWVQVERDDATAFLQLWDVGPSNSTDGNVVADYDYVWGNDQPKNEFGIGAGIDLSPAATDLLGTDGEYPVSWRFVSADDVPLAWRALEITDEMCPSWN